jgi:hypothetical protein
MAELSKEAKKKQARQLLEWSEQIVLNLAACGPHGAAVSAYMQTHRTRLAFKAQSGTDAFYWLGGHVHLNPASFSLATPPHDPRLLGIIAEEVTHLSGLFKLEPFSVYGELKGWQVNQRVFTACSGHPYGAPASGIWENKSRQWGELSSLALDHDRLNLERARQLMQEIGGPAYRIDLLPLYPPQRELWFDLKHGNFKAAWKTLKQLWTGLKLILK